MPDYLVSVRSPRSTFSIGFLAEDYDGAIRHVIALVKKARLPVGSSIVIVQPDGRETNVSEIIAAHLDRPDI